MEVTGATKPAEMEQFASSFTNASVPPEASKSSYIDDDKDIKPVLSCRLEDVVSIQPESLSLDGGIQRAYKWVWLEKVKGVLARIGPS